MVINCWQIVRGWDSDKRVQEHGIQGHSIPPKAGIEATIKPVERRQLGHMGRPSEDRLVSGAFHRRLHKLQRRSGMHLVLLSLLLLRRLIQRRFLAVPTVGLARTPKARVGAEKLHDL